MKRHVALVGFMAAGKSVMGKRLARKLECAFYDIDDLVSAEHGAISDIFYNEGEAAFRRYEQAALQCTIEDGKGGVIALGGGALTTAENCELLRKRAYRIFIKVSPETVVERLKHSRRVRPLIGPAPTLARIRELYVKRMPQYAHADHVVEADHLSSAQIVDDIILWLRKKKISL